MPTSRWISLSLNFPGVGSITRDRSSYKPVVCSEAIAAKLVEKFYAKVVDSVDLEATESTPPAVNYDRVLAAINACTTVDRLKELGLSSAKAVAVLETLPLTETTLVESIPAKILASIVAKFA